jgi:putative heme transporter
MGDTTFKRFIKRRWKLLVNIATLLALAVLVFAIREQLFDTVRNFSRVNIWVLLLVLPVEYLNYHAQARLYQQLFGLVGHKLSMKTLLRASLELNFVNHVFPSGGVTGISYFGLRLRGEGISIAKSTLTHAIKLILVFLSFEILLIFGMFILAVNGKASNMTIFIGSSLSTLLIVGTGIAIYVVSSRRRIEAFFTTLTKWLNKLIQLVRPKHPETINIAKAKEAFGEFHEGYKVMRAQAGSLKRPFMWAMIANITEVLVVLIVFIAFQQYVNVGAIILAYAVANFAGLVSVLPGGVGVYEALMTAVLATAGVPASVSLPAIVMYRVVNTVIQIPPGYYYYHRSITEGKMKPVSQNAP